MKLLFLDHDGVMVTAKQFGTRSTKWRKAKAKRLPTDSIDVRFDNFDTKCVEVLNEIIDQVPDLNIIVSSDWQDYATFNEMIDLYQLYGVSIPPYGYTPLLDELDLKQIAQGDLEHQRCFRIKKAVAFYKPTHWVAVDDLNLFTLSNFVRCTKVSEGIKQTGVKDKILQFLI